MVYINTTKEVPPLTKEESEKQAIQIHEWCEDFLRKLEEFEEEARKKIIMIKEYTRK